MRITNNASLYNTVFGIQCTGLRDSELQLQLDAMGGLNAYSFGLIAFTNEVTSIEYFPTDSPVVPLGSTKLIQLFHAGMLPDNWVVFHDPAQFSQEHYGPLLGSELVNSGSSIMPLTDALNLGALDEHVFIKPCDDLKMFPGVIVEPGMSLLDALQDVQTEELIETAPVIVAPWKKLYREYRVIVIDGVPTGFSQYKDHNNNIRAAALPLATRDLLYFKALELHKHWHPAPVYTIDFAEVGPHRQLKVVEYNCFNCSGMYKINRNMVFRDIAKYIDRLIGKR